MFTALSQPPFYCILVVSIKKDVFIPLLSKVTVQNNYLITLVEKQNWVLISLFIEWALLFSPVNRQQLATQFSSLLMVSTSSIGNKPKKPKQNIMLKVVKEIEVKHKKTDTRCGFGFYPYTGAWLINCMSLQVWFLIVQTSLDMGTLVIQISVEIAMMLWSALPTCWLLPVCCWR